LLLAATLAVGCDPNPSGPAVNPDDLKAVPTAPPVTTKGKAKLQEQKPQASTGLTDR
jgi:hypothetical protein